MTQNEKSTKYYSDRHEKRTAKDVKGFVQISSGATAFYKGDVITNKCLVECKTCTSEKKSMSIKKEWFDKLEEQRFAMGKQYGVLAFDFGDGENHFVIDEKTMRKFIEFLEQE